MSLSENSIVHSKSLPAHEHSCRPRDTLGEEPSQLGGHVVHQFPGVVEDGKPHVKGCIVGVFIWTRFDGIIGVHI